MKRTLTLILFVVLLSGCNYDDIPTKVHIVEANEQLAVQQYQPTPKQLATLFDTGNQKVLVNVNTPITYMVPEYYTCSFTSPSEVKNASYKFNVYKDYSSYITDENTIRDICTYSWYYLKKENIKEFQDNVVHYTGTISGNIAASDLYTSTFQNYDTLLLYGDLTPYKATKQTVSCNVSKYEELEDFQLPIAWYYWEIENGDYLVLRVKLESTEAGHLYDINDYLEQFCISENKVNVKQIKEDIEHAESLKASIDEEAEYITNYLLVGDYQERYADKSKQNSSSETVVTPIDAEEQEVTNVTWEVSDDKTAIPDVKNIENNRESIVITKESDIAKYSQHEERIKIDADSFIKQYMEEEEGLYDYTVDPVIDYFED